MRMQITEEMIECGAKALYKSELGWDAEWEKLPAELRASFRLDAKACLEAALMGKEGDSGDGGGMTSADYRCHG